MGEAIARQSGADTVHTIETLRKGFIQERREHDEDKKQQLIDLIASLDNQTLKNVIRAFSIYFFLANLTEENYLREQRRTMRAESNQSWEGSFRRTLLECRERNIAPEQIKELIDHLKLINSIFGVVNDIVRLSGNRYWRAICCISLTVLCSISR